MGFPTAAFNNGYGDLIPVHPGDKAPAIDNWRTSVATEELVASWEARGMNIGLRADHFPAVDIDITDVPLAEAVGAVVEEVFGETAVRIGSFPKRLMVFTTAAPFRKCTLTLTRGDEKHRVEVLGEGQQYVIHGMHPSGKPYEWVQLSLDELPADALTPISVERVRELFAVIARRVARDFGAEWVVTESLPGAPGETSGPPPATSLMAPTFDHAMKALAKIKNDADIDRETYVNIAHWLKGAVGAEHDADGCALFKAWAATWPGGSDAAEDIRVWNSIKRASLNTGWPQLRARAIQYGYRDAEEDFAGVPLPAPAPSPGAPTPTTPAAPTATPTLPLSQEELPVDERVAEYIAGRVAGRIAFSVDDDRAAVGWAYTGQRWEGGSALRDPAVVTVVSGEVDQLLRAIDAAYTAGPSKRLQALRERLGAASYPGSLVPKLAAHPKLSVPHERFNDIVRTGHLLNTPGGVVDLDTGALAPHDPQLYLTQITDVTPAEFGACPTWIAVVRRAMHEDDELVDYFQRAIGSALAADARERKFWYLYGAGWTGKTTMLETLAEALGLGGAGYAGLVPPGALARAKGSDRPHPEWLVNARLARVLIASEVNPGDRWDDALLKQLTAGDVISARAMFRGSVRFKWRATLFFSGNLLPDFRSLDSAIRDRARLLTVPPLPAAERDPELRTKLRAELPAILAWCIAGYQKWRQTGLAIEPKAVTAGTAELLDESDPVARFLSQECEVKQGEKCTALELWQRFSRFLTREGMQSDIATQHALTRALRLAGEGREPGWRYSTLRFDSGVHKGFSGLQLRDLDALSKVDELIETLPK